MPKITSSETNLDELPYHPHEKGGEKTIPFLRRLIDMLQDNEEAAAITFSPGVRKKCVPGRIVVHDRAQVESRVLPRYFNHASFASLRRQLNYFAFSREGKGKQKGATYTNDRVYELNDILHLKRRLPGTSEPLGQKPTSGLKNNSAPLVTEKASTVATKEKKVKQSSRNTPNSRRKRSRPKKTSKKVRKIIDSVVPVVHLPSKKARRSSYMDDFEEKPTTAESTTLLRTTKSISPGSSQILRKSGSIVLDLTKPENEECSTTSSNTSSAPENKWMYRPVTVKRDVYFNIPAPPVQPKKEDDVIAGCSALLSLGWQKA